MRIFKFSLLYVALLFGQLSAAVEPPPSIVESRWQYDGFFYDGVRYPNPNPDLVLIYTFYDDGLNWLSWFRANENGFCESLSNYSIEGDVLYQKTIWQNPLNAMSCPQDSNPDEVSATRYSIEGQELRLHLEIDGRPFLYILKYIGPATPAL